jgi:hypothetical protein
MCLAKTFSFLRKKKLYDRGFCVAYQGCCEDVWGTWTPGLQLGCLDNMSHCLHVPSSNISSQCRVQEASAKLIFLCQKLAVMGGDVDIQSRLFLATHPSIRCAPLSQKTSY